MTKLEAHIEQFLGNNPMQKFFVATSGGVDSMVLLHVLYSLGKNVSALHVNYMLRGEDSEKDQKLVEEFCKKRSIPCHIKRVDLNRYLQQVGGNLQDTARKVRYSYFESFKLKKDFFIVLGQHADDQVETFFLNLARGGGIMGLSGMLAEHNRYLRPFLNVKKEEILAYAIENNIVWREDASNSSNKYHRNKLRNVLIPEMEITSPQLRENVLLLMNVFQETQRNLEQNIAKYTAQINESGELSFAEFDAFNDVELIELLRQLKIQSGFLTEIKKLRNAQRGKFIDLKGELVNQIHVELDHLYFEKPQQVKALPELILSTETELPKTFNKNSIYLDPNKIKGQLELRYWKIGDRMKPVGVNGSKLISDILADAKVPSRSKRQQLVLSDDEKILWCVGFSIGKEALAQTDSEILKISIDEQNF